MINSEIFLRSGEAFWSNCLKRHNQLFCSLKKRCPHVLLQLDRQPSMWILYVATLHLCPKHSSFIGSSITVIVVRFVSIRTKHSISFVSKPKLNRTSHEKMDQAKEFVQKRVKNKDYMPYWKIIDRRWDNQLHSALHATAYYLNPKFSFAVHFLSTAKSSGVWIIT